MLGLKRSEVAALGRGQRRVGEQGS
jgi:hypothetical protein